MGGVFESDFGVYVHDFFAAVLHQVVGGFEPFLYEPFLRGQFADLFEIAFEGGKAAAGVVGKFFHGEVVGIIFVHKFEQIYLPRLGEVEKGWRESFADVK